MSVAHGSCLCGAVRFRIEPAPREVWFCHCGQCRKAQGTAFAASVPVPLAHFVLESGGEHLNAWRSTPVKARWFCSQCGSPIYSQVDGRDMLRVRAGVLELSVALTPVGHIHVADRASWDHFSDDLPQYPGQEPGR